MGGGGGFFDVYYLLIYNIYIYTCLPALVESSPSYKQCLNGSVLSHLLQLKEDVTKHSNMWEGTGS